MFTPRLEIYPDRILHNAKSILSLCKKYNVDVAAVTKVTAANRSVVDALVRSGVQMLADSRIENLAYIKSLGVKLPLMALRLPTITRAKEYVDTVDISLVSSLETIRALVKAVTEKIHKVILMIDVGDLREGVTQEMALDILKTAKEIKGIEVVGLGCNLACFGGVVPTNKNTSVIVDLRNEARKTLSLELPILSGGNSSGLELLAKGKLPKEINNYRVHLLNIFNYFCSSITSSIC